MKKYIVVLLSLMMMCCAIGCGGREIVTYDPKKVQLFVGNVNAGFGDKYIEAIGARFEELYQDTEFGEKIGVEIIIDNNANFNAPSIKASDNAVYFSEGLNYYDFIAQGVFADITDLVKQDLAEFGEAGKSIESKMEAYGNGAQEFFRTAAGKYYAIPASEGMYHMIYDMDLFRERSLYFRKSGAPSEFERPQSCVSAPLAGNFGGYLYTNGLEHGKSAGPDGAYGTVDDGLPATYDEFFQLLDYMVNDKFVKPFTWSGAVASAYNARFASQLYADYEGLKNVKLNFTLDGMADTLATVSRDGKVTMDAAPTKIGVSNAYELSRQAGRFYATDFWRRILNNPDYYTTNSVSPFESQTQAQSTYLYSSYLPNKQANAFLCDGNWWQNEADDTFTAIVQSYGEDASRQNRQFGILPSPKATMDKVGEKTLFLSGFNSSVFINANAKGVEKELAEKFLLFSMTDESLMEYTNIVGCSRPYEYDITGYGMSETDEAYQDAVWAKMSSFTKNLWEYHMSGSLYYSSCSNNYALNHWEFFNIYERALATNLGGKLISPYDAWNNDKLSSIGDSKAYFDGIQSYSKNYWENTIRP